MELKSITTQGREKNTCIVYMKAIVYMKKSNDGTDNEVHWLIWSTVRTLDMRYIDRLDQL